MEDLSYFGSRFDDKKTAKLLVGCNAQMKFEKMFSSLWMKKGLQWTTTKKTRIVFFFCASISVNVCDTNIV